MTYKGVNRRVHTCFITQNREYHFRAGECVAVRDRNTSVWISGHRAVGMRLRPLPPGTVYIGKELELYAPGTVIRTSQVVDILRPGKKQVHSYRFVLGFFPDDLSA
ncbi:MAG: hypothetical protein M0R76_03040 [Proteobacteria bacterium]|nr:hypothetical protein [Pseudomonadota bacterium]NLN62480.1 hypothetical protein [Myxococcales bacterium]